MNFNPDIHRRRSIRLKAHDYSQAGAYFVTICTWNKECLFGEIVNGEVRVNNYGQAVQDEWFRTAVVRPSVILDAFIVMPNHCHGILMVTPDGRGTARRAPTVERFGRPVAGSLPTIIRSFKSAATRRINVLRCAPGIPVWQRNYYERAVRDDAEMHRVREYIAENPARWLGDEENPDNSI